MPIASELGDAAYLWPKAHESASALDRGRVLVGHQLQEIDMGSMKGKQMSDLVCARTCNECRALEMLQAEPARCTLGFRFDNMFRPVTPCLKPTTIRELIAANTSREAR